MIRMCLAGLACVSLWIAPGQENSKTSKGPAPRFFEVTDMDRDTVELKEARDEASGTIKATLSTIQIYDAAGNKLTAEEFQKRIKTGSIVLVADDEGKVDPSYLRVFRNDTVILGGVVKSRPVWTMDLKMMKPFAGPLAGKILGADFNPDKIQLQNTGLNLRSGRDMIHIFVTIKPGRDVYEFNGDDPPKGRPAIHVHINSTKPPGVTAYTTGYAMRLEFGKEVNGRIPARLYLSLPDDRKSCIAGTFSVAAD